METGEDEENVYKYEVMHFKSEGGSGGRGEMIPSGVTTVQYSGEMHVLVAKEGAHRALETNNNVKKKKKSGAWMKWFRPLIAATTVSSTMFSPWLF